MLHDLVVLDPVLGKRLLLNLMLANQGLHLGAAMALVGAVIGPAHRDAALAVFGLTLATGLHTVVTIPLLTPRDSTHAIPSALAAVPIVIGSFER